MSLVRVGAVCKAVRIPSHGSRQSHFVCIGIRRLATSATSGPNISSIRRPTIRGLARLGGTHHRHLSALPSTCTYYDYEPFIQYKETNTPKPDAPKIAVVGGGLTGLTAAYFLAKFLPSSAHITVYEGSSRWGGWLHSDKVPVDVGGVKTQVLFERGARSMSTAQTGGRMDRLILYTLLNDFGLPLTPLDGKQPRWILNEGRLAAVPPCSIVDALNNPVLREVALPLIIGGLKNYFRRTPYPRVDMSIADFLQHTYGSKALSETLMSAIAHGVWGGNVHELSCWAVAPHMLGWPAPMTVHDDMTLFPANELLLWRRVTSHLGKATLRKMFSLDNSTMVSFEQHGMETLPQMIADALGSMPNVELKLGTLATDIAYRESHDDVVINHEDSKPYHKVISSLPAKQLHKATGGVLPLQDFKSVSIMTVNVWYPYEDIISKGLGYLIPATVPEEDNPERALGVFFDSGVGVGAGRVEILGERLPERGTKLFVLMGGHYFEEGHPIPTEEEAIQQAKNLLERQLGIPKDTPCHIEARLAKDCLSQHLVGHMALIEHLGRGLQSKFQNRLATIGGSFNRPGVAGALRAGYDMAFNTNFDNFLTTGLEGCEWEQVTCPSFVKVPPSAAVLKYNAHLPKRRAETEGDRRLFGFESGKETLWPTEELMLPSGRWI